MFVVSPEATAVTESITETTNGTTTVATATTEQTGETTETTGIFDLLKYLLLKNEFRTNSDSVPSHFPHN